MEVGIHSNYATKLHFCLNLWAHTVLVKWAPNLFIHEEYQD